MDVCPTTRGGEFRYNDPMLDALLFSVSYSGSWGQETLGLEQFVDRAAELGFEGVMLGGKRPHLSVLDWGAGGAGAAAGANRGAGAQARVRRGVQQLHGRPGAR